MLAKCCPWRCLLVPGWHLHHSWHQNVIIWRQRCLALLSRVDARLWEVNALLFPYWSLSWGALVCWHNFHKFGGGLWNQYVQKIKMLHYQFSDLYSLCIRERERVCVCMYVHMYMCVCACKNVCMIMCVCWFQVSCHNAGPILFKGKSNAETGKKNRM